MTLTTLALDDVGVGTALPELPIPITTTLIVAGALASRDFTPLHHDKGAAEAGGMRNVFMNILTTNGLVGRYVTDWAGPSAVLKRIAIKLGAPNLPGDTMTITGVVTKKDAAAGVVEVEVAGRNAWGDHVNGTVVVALPRKADG
jgi:3-oxo-4,17-pregnadiene-20-carboxyl-CoA hydratase beta subunit